jgi:hypothetical protein
MSSMAARYRTVVSSIAAFGTRLSGNGQVQTGLSADSASAQTQRRSEPGDHT